jgi:hypothetical protein
MPPPPPPSSCVSRIFIDSRELCTVKAVNREDKRSRRYETDISRNLKGLVAIEIATAVSKKSLAAVAIAIWFFETQPR